MLTVQGIVFIAGAVFVLIAILGGGFTIRELTVPEMSKNKRIGSGVIGALFIAYSLIMPPFSISTETSDTPGMRLIYAPDNDELDASEKDKLQASNLIVAAAHSPPQLNDLITVQFTLRNIGQRPITLEYVYVGANDPTHKYDADTSRGLGNFDLNETLEPNEEYHLKKVWHLTPRRRMVAFYLL